MTYYYYKLTVDDGGAPCCERGLLSFAICKPGIRSTADVGDVVFGFAGDVIDPENPLIYVAVVTKKIKDGGYYKQASYASRSDCVYKWADGQYVVRRNARFHGSLADLEHDLGEPPSYSRANVLLSTEFRYFGSEGAACYDGQQYPEIAAGLRGLRQGHRVNHSGSLVLELSRVQELVFRAYENSVNGPPTHMEGCHPCDRDDNHGCAQ